MTAIQKWNLLDPARVDRMSLEHRMLHEARARIDIRMRKHLEQMWNDELSSGEVDEPVTDNGDTFILKIHYWILLNNWDEGMSFLGFL